MIFAKNKIIASFIGLGLLLPLVPNIALAENYKPVSFSQNPSQFQKLEQPLSLKLIVVLSGLGLIGMELWWFVFSKNKTK